MTRGKGFLVVGADSLVGGGLVAALERRGHEVFASTRRRDTVGAGRIYIDFEDESSFRAPADSDYAYVVAAATSYVRCEKDPLAHRTNTELIPRFIASMLEQGLFVTFISSNSVFGGERPWPNEDDSHAPGFPYAHQKAEAEKRVRAEADCQNARDRLNVVRLTKILSRDTPPLPSWFGAWSHGQVVQPFTDLIFAPMSVRFVSEALATIGERRVSGNLHLSGARNVSYVDLATALAAKLGVRTKLIDPTTSEQKGVSIPFKPRYSGLGMAVTTRHTGVVPQPLAGVVEDLMASIPAR